MPLLGLVSLLGHVLTGDSEQVWGPWGQECPRGRPLQRLSGTGPVWEQCRAWHWWRPPSMGALSSPHRCGVQPGRSQHRGGTVGVGTTPAQGMLTQLLCPQGRLLSCSCTSSGYSTSSDYSSYPQTQGSREPGPRILSGRERPVPHGPLTGLLLQADPPLMQPGVRCLFLQDPTPGWNRLRTQHGLQLLCCTPRPSALWASALHASVPLHGRPLPGKPFQCLLSGEFLSLQKPATLHSCPGALVPRWPGRPPRAGPWFPAGLAAPRVVGSLPSARCLAAAQEMPSGHWDRLPCSSEIRRPARREHVTPWEPGRTELP